MIFFSFFASRKNTIFLKYLFKIHNLIEKFILLRTSISLRTFISLIQNPAKGMVLIKITRFDMVNVMLISFGLPKHMWVKLYISLVIFLIAFIIKIVIKILMGYGGKHNHI